MGSVCKCTELRTLNLRGCSRIGELFAYSALATRFGFRNLEKLDARDTSAGNSEVSCSAGFIFVQYLHGFLGQFCHLDICILSTHRQMPQTITNITHCLPKILTVPKFWYHLAHSFSREKFALLTLRGLFESLRAPSQSQKGHFSEKMKLKK